MKAPFTVIFSNDTTNILTCTSPYHRKGEPFRPEMLEATVDETAGTGVEAHFIQLAHGWVPWYKSKVYPVEDHIKWWKKRYGVDPIGNREELAATYLRYLVDGGDMLKVFIDRCRRHGQAPFVSLRLNDVHHLENVDVEGNSRGLHSICRFYAEHPEYRLGTGRRPEEKGQNWAIDEVRAYKYDLIKEQCEDYDIDGFELDFMRRYSFFRLDETSSQERRSIIAEFVRSVRELLDRTSESGKRRWLCVRVPCHLSMHDALGIDLGAMVQAGVDMINLSPTYLTDQQTDMAKVCEFVGPRVSVYLEMCHCTLEKKVSTKGYDSQLFRRTTDEQFFTAAYMARARGAAGVSLFNFVYYREHGTEGRGPFQEPPFHLIRSLASRQSLSKLPQHYFLAANRLSKERSRNVMPIELAKGDSAKLVWDMEPPERGWSSDARLRIQSDAEMNDAEYTVYFGDQVLQSVDDLSEPYPNPYPPLLGTPETLRAWFVPRNLLRPGANPFRIEMTGGSGQVKLMFIDLAVR